MKSIGKRLLSVILVVTFLSSFMPGSMISAVAAEPQDDAQSGLVSLNVRAHIDGMSQLTIQNNTLVWDHYSFSPPGKYYGNNYPTYVNEYEWMPWDGVNTTYAPVLSAPLSLSEVGIDLGFSWELVDIDVREGRGSVTVEQWPSPDNEYYCVVQFDDGSPGGAVWYDVTLELKPGVQTREVTLNLTDENVAPLADGYTVNWYISGSDTAVGTGNVIHVLDDDGETTYDYEILLGESLGTVYKQPPRQPLLLEEGQSDITVALEKISAVTVHGAVNNPNGAPLPGAAVSFQGLANGSFAVRADTTADEQGKFELTVPGIPGVVTISHAGYYDLTIPDAVTGESPAETDLGTVTLSPLGDKRILMALTERTAGPYAADQSLLSFSNLSFMLQNVSSGQDVTAFTAQYPYLYIEDESVSFGDALEISARDNLNRMTAEPVRIQMDETGKTAAEIVFLDNGYFAFQADKGGIALIFDAQGDFVESVSFTGGIHDYPQSGPLPAGEYTAVFVEKSDLLHKTQTVGKLAEFGLIDGADYVSRRVVIENGAVNDLGNIAIPVLSQEKLSFTEIALFTVNKQTVAAGAGAVTCRAEYVIGGNRETSGETINIEFPEGMAFYGNVVTLDGQQVPFTYQNRVLTVVTNQKSGVLRFYALPAETGTMLLSAELTCQTDGGRISQPLGQATVTATPMQIDLPERTGVTTVTVSGLASANAKISVFDNDHLAGETVANHVGHWQLQIELHQPYSISDHLIYAVAENDVGLRFTSETRLLAYNSTLIYPTKVTMINKAHSFAGGEGRTVIDLVNPNAIVPYYYFEPRWPTFTFVVEFNNPDAFKGDVTVYTTDRNGEITEVPTVYDPAEKYWVGTADYTSYTCPQYIQVSNDDDYYEVFSDSEMLRDEMAAADANHTAYVEAMATFGDIDALIDQETQKEAPDYSAVLARLSAQDADNSTTPEEKADYENELALMDDDAHTKYLEDYLEETQTTLEQHEASAAALHEELRTGSDYTVGQEIDGYQVTVMSRSCTDADVSALIDAGCETIPTSAGGNIYLLTDGDRQVYVNPEEDIYYEVSGLPTDAPMPRTMARAADNGSLASLLQAVTSAKNQIQITLQNTLLAINKAITNNQLKIDNITKEIQVLDREISQTRANIAKITNPGPQYKEQLKLLQEKLARQLTTKGEMAAQRTAIQKLLPKLSQLIGKVTGYASTAMDCISVAMDAISLYRQVLAMAASPSHQCDTTLLAAEVVGIVYVMLGVALGFGLVQGACIGAALASAGTVAGALLFVMGAVAAANASIAINTILKNIAQSKINACYAACGDEPPEEDKKDKGNGGKVTDIQDPSGYAYEAVPSNRLSGVTATAYFSDTQQTENAGANALWDAQTFSQNNPLTTDGAGRYAWDVPAGWWQVQYEKSGYDKACSEWLPVPPPQTEVNIGLVSKTPPTVIYADAYPDGIEIGFSKYMQISSLDTTSVAAFLGENPVSGRIEPIDAEENPETSQTYASKFRFVLDTPLAIGSMVRIAVTQNVRSYAGIGLAEPLIVTETVKAEPETLSADSITLKYGESGNLMAYVTPVEAAAGRKLLITAETPSLAVATVNEAAFCEKGCATVPVTAKLPGKAYFSLTLDGTDLSVQAVVIIGMTKTNDPAEKAETPTANPPAGAVKQGTEITLTTATEGAMIHYSTDGGDPSKGQMYMEPIEINSDTTIKAVTIKAGMQNSDILTARYTIIDDTTPPSPPPSTPSTPSGGRGSGIKVNNTPAEPTASITPPETPASNSLPAQLRLNTSGGGYISGYQDDTVRPENNLTRYEAATIFHVLIDDTGKAAANSQFSDTVPDQWYSAAVGYLSAKGVLSGYPDGTFRGDSPITRAEFIAIASKFGEMNPGGELPFTDVGSGHWAYDAIKSAYNNGWISGYPDGTFAPNRNITRAEAIVITNKMLGWDKEPAPEVLPKYTDLISDKWYYKYVLLAVEGVQ